MQVKCCSRCKNNKPLCEFNKRKHGILGVQSYCRTCGKQYNKHYFDVNKEKRAQYYLTNIEKFTQYRIANKENRKKYFAAYSKQRYSMDPVFAIKARIRARVRLALAGASKTQRTQELVGCSWQELRSYLESKFQPGMTWDNRSEWHIDHIRPLASFDLTDEAQLREACHYTNLQPLWAKDNISKRDTYKEVAETA